MNLLASEITLLALLIVRKKYLTVLSGRCGGILYMIVDYGIFHLALHTRPIEGGDLFAVLLWMSMSYGTGSYHGYMALILFAVCFGNHI